MTTVQARSRDVGGDPDIKRSLLSELFVELFPIYEQGTAEVKEIISSMVAVCKDPQADADERLAALDTLSDILFPPKNGEGLGIDLEGSASAGSGAADKAQAAMRQEEKAFAGNLRRIMRERKVSQKALAELIGVGQPAISMMLNRQCRPQRSTVDKLAQALKVAPKKLWPKA